MLHVDPALHPPWPTTHLAAKAPPHHGIHECAEPAVPLLFTKSDTRRSTLHEAGCSLEIKCIQRDLSSPRRGRLPCLAFSTKNISITAAHTLLGWQSTCYYSRFANIGWHKHVHDICVLQKSIWLLTRSMQVRERAACIPIFSYSLAESQCLHVPSLCIQPTP